MSFPFLTIAGCLLTLGSFSPSKTLGPQSDRKKVAERASHYMETCEALGWSGTVLIERKGKVLLLEGYGLAQRDKGIACAPETLYEIASATKPFTACAVMCLVEDRKLALDDSIAKHLPGVPEDKQGITVEHLLAHTSGMARNVGGGGGDDLEAAVLSNLGPPAARAPGEQHEYWNGGYALLAGIVETASGMSYTDFVKTRIFKPAGMKASGFAGDDLPVQQQAFGYTNGGGRLAAEHAYQGSYGWHYRGMGGLVTTAEDLHAFTRAFAKGRIVRSKTVKDMWAPRSEFYGLGWGIATNTPTKGRRIGHGGDVAGFHTSYQHFPDDDATIIVLTNADGVPTWKIGWDLEAILFGKEPTHLQLPERVQLSDKQLRSMAGTYAANEEQRIELAVFGAGLTLEFKSDGPVTQTLSPRESADLARFELIMEAMLQGDSETLSGYVAERVPTTWGRLVTDQLWPARIVEMGPLLAHEVVQVEHLERNDYTTFWVKLTHAKGEAWLQAGLEGGRLGHLRLNPKGGPDLTPAIVYLVPVSETRLLGFSDLEKPSHLELTLAGKGKRPDTLQLKEPGQDWAAFHRISTH